MAHLEGWQTVVAISNREIQKEPNLSPFAAPHIHRSYLIADLADVHRSGAGFLVGWAISCVGLWAYGLVGRWFVPLCNTVVFWHNGWTVV
jgi:hypothetical protein